MQVPLMDLKIPYMMLREELLAAVDEALTSMQLFLGPNVQALEADWAKYCDATHAIGVGNGTEAISLALKAAGVKAGDEVVTVSWTFIATIEAIAHIGAIPVVADIDRNNYTLNPQSFAAAITPRTRAVVPVHVFGHPADMDAIREIASSREIVVIEDAAQSHGARYKGRRTGSLGHAATFSFYQTKNLGGYGEGGIVTTNCDWINDNMRLLRNHGHVSKYEHGIIGYNGRLDEIQAAMLRIKLRHLDEWNARRCEIAKLYTKCFASIDVETPLENDWAQTAWHLYTLRTPRRNELAQAFDEANIGYSLHYQRPAHTQPACAEFGLNKTNLPVTMELAQSVIQIPLYPHMTDDQINYVCEIVTKTLS